MAFSELVDISMKGSYTSFSGILSRDSEVMGFVFSKVLSTPYGETIDGIPKRQQLHKWYGLLYYHGEYSGARASHPHAADVFCLSVTLLNGIDCAKHFEFRNGLISLDREGL